MVELIVKVPKEKLLAGPNWYFAEIEFCFSVGVIVPGFAHRTTTILLTPRDAVEDAGLNVQPVAEPV